MLFPEKQALGRESDTIRYNYRGVLEISKLGRGCVGGVRVARYYLFMAVNGTALLSVCISVETVDGRVVRKDGVSVSHEVLISNSGV